MELLTLPPLLPATVVARPSRTIRSPYVADIQLDDGTPALCHTPGLGCSGLVEAGKRIYVSKSSEAAKTDYTAQIAVCSDSEGSYNVGVHPMISQAAARSLLSLISNSAVWESEVVVHEGTRLDFVGSTDSGKIYVEVKNAMISHDTHKHRAERRAIFPDGFRKCKSDPISPRAVKHAQTLGGLCATPGNDCVLVFIVPRNDCGDGLHLNALDPIYVSAVRDAIRSGVRIRAFALDYGLDSKVRLHREIAFYIDF